MRIKQKHGFSLVELAIVLVIIGLIVGGILTGQDLIRASEVNSVIADVNKVNVAIDTFRLKYNGLPGDIKNASSYWPSCASPATLCDGNGNGMVGYWSGEMPEGYRAWQILSLAGLLPGSYTGITAGGADPNTSVVGTNVPEISIGGVGVDIASWGIQGNTAWLFAGNYKNMMFIGRDMAGEYLQSNFLTPQEAYSLDTKADDGFPSLGKWRPQFSAGSCHNGSTGSSAAYALSTTTVVCPMLYLPTP